MTTTDAPMQIDTDAQTFRYYRHAVEKHWDPHDIDLDADRENLSQLDDEAFEGLKRALALFGATKTPSRRISHRWRSRSMTSRISCSSRPNFTRKPNIRTSSIATGVR